MLINGGFESGALAPWGSDGDVSLGPGRGSANGVRMCGANDSSGELWQALLLPSADAAQLQFWWRADSAAAQSGDLVDLMINYGSGVARLYTMRAVEPLELWRRAVIDLSAYAGMHVKLVFLGQTNATAPTLFRLDDASVRVCLGARELYLPLVVRRR